jgi:hypothetical protein
MGGGAAFAVSTGWLTGWLWPGGTHPGGGEKALFGSAGGLGAAAATGVTAGSGAGVAAEVDG